MLHQSHNLCYHGRRYNQYLPDRSINRYRDQKYRSEVPLLTIMVAYRWYRSIVVIIAAMIVKIPFGLFLPHTKLLVCIEIRRRREGIRRNYFSCEFQAHSSLLVVVVSILILSNIISTCAISEKIRFCNYFQLCC